MLPAPCLTTCQTNDAAGSVHVLIDRDLKDAARLIFHPNINTASVVVSWADLERFLGTRANRVSVIALPGGQA